MLCAVCNPLLGPAPSRGKKRDRLYAKIRHQVERKFRHYEFNPLVSGQQRRLIYTESESHMDGFCGMADAEWLTEDEFRNDRRRTLVIRIEPKRHLDPREMERECTTGWVTLHRLPFVSFAEYTDYGLTCYCQCQTGQSKATVVWAVRRALQEAGENLRTVAAPTIAKLVRTTAKILQAHVQHECPGPDVLTLMLPPDDGISLRSVQRVAQEKCTAHRS